MWDALAKDLEYYRALRFPNHAAWWSAPLVALSSPGLIVLAMHRTSRALLDRRSQRRLGLADLPLRLTAYASGLLTLLLMKSDVLADIDVEPGVFLSNKGHMIIGARAIGRGTIIHHRVTIGMNLADRSRPAIGRNVWIGRDCVIYGNITIGDDSVLLPGTVLTKSIPSGVVVSGNPARIVPSTVDKVALRHSLGREMRGETAT